MMDRGKYGTYYVPHMHTVLESVVDGTHTDWSTTIISKEKEDNIKFPKKTFVKTRPISDRIVHLPISEK